MALLLGLALLPHAWSAEEIQTERAANTVILDAIGVKNLGIETVPVERRDFQSTLFAIGRIEEIPAHRSVLSSRIAGRALKVHAFVGDHVQEGQILVEVESRQPGNPPPVIPLKAPQEGLIVDSHVQVGQPIEPDAELLDISDRSQMWAVAKIPEKGASTLSIGTPARIEIPAVGGEPILADLTRFGVAADRQTGTVEGIFQIPNDQNQRLQPGMRAEFAIVTGSRPNVLAVPRQAIQGDPSQRFVFVEDFDLPNAFVKVPVQLGEENARFVEIVSGLFEGDEVVTQGAYSLGFAGAGSMSLKEALDAAHGHEHAEDGSEIAETDTPDTPSEDHHAHADPSPPIFLLTYAALVTLLFLVTLQQLWQKRKSNAGLA